MQKSGALATPVPIAKVVEELSLANELMEKLEASNVSQGATSYE